MIILFKRFKGSGYYLEKSSEYIKTLEKIYLDDYVIIDEKTMKILESIYGKCVREKVESAKISGQPLHLFEYRLYAISTHSGSLYGGHYTAHVKHGNSWYYVSDSYAKQESLENALNAEAYVLFYERIW